MYINVKEENIQKNKLLEYIYKNIDGFYYYNHHKELIKVILIGDILKLLEDNNLISSRWIIYDNWKYKDLPIEKQSIWLIQQVYLIIKKIKKE